MSDDWKQIERQLEQATASDLPADAPLGAETAELRETWLQLGQLLEAAGTQRDEPIVLRSAPPPVSLENGRPMRLATLAASLLLCVALGWLLVATMRNDTSPGAPDDVAQDAKDEPTAADYADDDTLPPAESDPLDWDDSLDEQIAQLGEQLVSVQQEWDRVGDSFGPIYDGLDQVEEEFEDDTL